MGKRDYPAANCVRALFGESPSEESADEIIELRCNIDDMTGEEIGFAFDKLLNAGAADVYTVPTGMKKNRPGIMLCVLCNAEKTQRNYPHIVQTHKHSRRPRVQNAAIHFAA